MKKSRGYSFKLLTLLSSASVSVAPAALFGAVSLLAPTSALALNDCIPVGVDPAVNGTATDSYVCNNSIATLSTTGITYSSSGALIIDGTSAISVGPIGINLTGNGSDSVTWIQTTGVITGTSGPVMDVTTGTGAISITTTGITGTSATAPNQVTFGILANSTSGAITIVDTGTINVGSTSATALQRAAIQATTSGAINITTSGAVTGRIWGIQTANTTGSTTINANNSVSINTTAGTGLAAIDAVSTTGAQTVNVGGTTGTINGSNGSAIKLVSTTGSQTVSILAGRTVSANATTPGVIAMSGSGARTITNAGSLSAGNTGVAVLATGTTFSLTNSGTLTGRLSLSGITGASTVTNSGTWTTSGASHLGGAASTLTNSGTLNVNGDSAFTSLETFNNSGTIALGTNTLTLNGGTFTGSGASLVTTTVTATDSGLLSLPGVTTAGVTAIRVTGAGITDTSLFSDTPIVLVDVTGGATAEGHFVLDAGSSNFVNGVLVSDGSLFGRALRFNGDAQHALVSVPTSTAYEFVPALHQTLATWHTTAEVVAGRQADLRAGQNGGMWVRLIGDRTERDFTPSFASDDDTFDFDSGYSLYTGAAVVGFDVLSGESSSGNYVMGFHGGLVRTRLEFNNSETTDDMDGVTLGVYGGMANGPLSFDATVNANLLSLDHNEPTLGDTSTNVISIGGRGEVGYTMNLSEAFYIQPIVTGAYVRTTIDDLFPKAYEVTFDDVESARAAVGMRIGADAGTVMGPVGFWLTGRIWKEFADEANVSINSTGATEFVFADDMSGEFEELTGGLTLDAGSARFFLSAGAQFHDLVDNYNASAGVRWRW